MPRKRSSCTPRRTGCPAYKNWDALLTAAVRKGMEDGKAPGDVQFWRYGSWHVVDIEHPLARLSAAGGRIAGTGPQPLSGDTTTVKQVGRDFGPSQRFTMDWSNVDGSTENIVLGESSDPYSAVLPRPVERLLHRHNLRAALYAGGCSRRRPATRCGWCHDATGPGGKRTGSRSASFPRRFAGPAVILAAAALATAPQAIWGNSCGHDFDFHLVSWFDALNAWRHGIAYPHWTPSANYGAGEPRFVFYSPLTWMLGAALASVMPWQLVPVALTFLLLAGTGLAARALAREKLDDFAATIAGCMALFSGYALFNAYERSAFAEFAGGVWIPLVLLYALRMGDTHAKQGAADASVRVSVWRSIAPLAVAIAGAWLSNPTVGVMACYMLAAVALAMLLLSRSLVPALRAAAGAALGLGLAAFYLIPATWEQRWVDIKQVTEDPGQTLENNWLFAVHADPSLALHDQVLRTVSFIAIAMIAVTLAALLVCRLRRRLPGERAWWMPLALIPFTVLLLQFPMSRPIWNLLPEMRFLQFPWRWLLVLESPLAVFAAAAIAPREPAHLWRRVTVGAAAAAVFVALTAWATTSLYQPCDDEDAVSGMLNSYRAGQGFEGTYEYEPIGSDISLIAMNLPEACLVSDPTIALGKPDDDGNLKWSAPQGTCRDTFAAAAGSRPEHLRIYAESAHAGYLILRLRSYPAWQVRVNGRTASSLPQRDDGLIAVPVPQARST